ncbi:tetratricopeptide repeat protein [Candidatus Kinetoplastidibacterium galati]|uniref:Tetratricopeptide repeat family protein n=1 Tax=Candidatus Kinetoplastidibacterium galati TCC219 TaxID=1208921 RepID=M1M0P7_9PROT|nr:tetratricopeptide repeat family protein [Candidatus Kinetoplastibacterium galatii]AGF48879.1 tetratricopeptide repeat family protein [Candidatus Kinetoplastibacterium galatii TCC219]
MLYLIVSTKTTLAGEYYTTQQTTKSNINNKTWLNKLIIENSYLSSHKDQVKTNSNSENYIKKTKSHIKEQIDSLIENDQYEYALQLVKENKINTSDNRTSIDIQLALREAIILNKLGYQDKAYELYKEMTILFPEIPELWNNLAIVCAEKGLADEAIYNINMSIKCCPIYETAKKI